jgi:hypothetical protein
MALSHAEIFLAFSLQRRWSLILYLGGSMSKVFSRILIVVVCLGLSVARAEDSSSSHTGPAVTSATSSSTGFDPARLELFRGKKLENVDPVDMGATFNQYIAPNEHFNYLFEGCLPKEGGAYISVGTFRGMNVASSGKVSHLVLMDINTSAIVFNKINTQLVAKAKDRFEYLSLLFTGVPQEELEKKAKSGEISMSEFTSKLTEKTPEDIFRVWQDTTKIVLSETDSKAFTNNFGGALLVASFMRRTMARELDLYFKAGIGDKTFFGSDERFSTLKRMTEEDRITVVPGNIAGDKTMDSLNSLFREQDMKVSGVDISNVPDYLTQPGQQKAAVENIRKLPFREGGRILLTSDHPDSRRPKIDEEIRWDYFALHHDNGMPGFEFPSRNNYTKKLQKRDGSGELTKIVKDPSNPPEFSILFSPEDAPCK